MASERGQQASLTPLPSVEQLPTLAGGGFDPERVKEAFESFRRHTTQLQVQLRVLQAAFSVAFAERYTLGALLAFIVTVSDVTILNIGAPFWGLVFGFAASWLLDRGDQGQARG